MCVYVYYIYYETCVSLSLYIYMVTPPPKWTHPFRVGETATFDIKYAFCVSSKTENAHFVSTKRMFFWKTKQGPNEEKGDKMSAIWM